MPSLRLAHRERRVAAGPRDDEIVIEVRDKFSVVELQSLPSGAQVKVKDRVVVR